MNSFPARAVGGISGSIVRTALPFATGVYVIPYIFSPETADSNPGAGVLRLNNTTPSSATTLRISVTGVDGLNWAEVLASLITNVNSRGVVRLSSVSNPLAWASFIFSAVVDAAGYKNITISYLGAGPVLFQTGDIIILSFANFKSTTSTNNNAAVGELGEYVETAVEIGSSVSLVTATAKTVASISLTAGDWDVNGIVNFQNAAGTTYTRILGGIGVTTNAVPDAGYSGAITFPSHAPGASSGLSITCQTRRVSISGTTTIYLIAFANFATSTSSAYGIIRARRVR